MYYLFYADTGEIIGFYDDIDEAITNFVLKRNNLYQERLYNSINNIVLLYYINGDYHVLY